MNRENISIGVVVGVVAVVAISVGIWMGYAFGAEEMKTKYRNMATSTASSTAKTITVVEERLCSIGEALLIRRAGFEGNEYRLEAFDHDEYFGLVSITYRKMGTTTPVRR